MRVGSLCSGYGGLDAAAEAVLGGEVAWVADNDPDKSAILARRFPGVPNLGDLEAVDWSAVEPVDVLTAGFPCTDISCAGRRAGLRKGNRSGVWYFVARAIAELRPPLVVIENVKELLSERADSDVESCTWCLGDAGPESAMRALGAVLADLAEIGFDAEWVSVPAASAGACHLRWRVFILAWPAADACSARGRQIARGASGDEGQDARWSSQHDHRQGGDRANPLADTAGPRQARSQDARPGGGYADTGMRSAEPQRGGGERALADTASISEREPADEADPIAGGREPRAVPSGGSARATAGGGQASGSNRDDAPDAECGGRRGRTPEPERGPEWGTAAAWHRPGAFGRYEAAVRRHERVFGRLVPAPVEPARNGNPRLSPRFSEWMMGLPDGWVTDVPGLSRNAQLKAIGDGVMPQQAAMALQMLLGRADIAPLVAAEEVA